MELYDDFCQYGFATTLQRLPIDKLRAMGDVIARAEISGSEGCYVEVARWHEGKKCWCRYAFLKCFGGELPEFPNLGAKETADEIASYINAGHDHEPLIYNFPTY